MFAKRPNTKAAKMNGQIPSKIASVVLNKFLY